MIGLCVYLLKGRCPLASIQLMQIFSSVIHGLMITDNITGRPRAPSPGACGAAQCGSWEGMTGFS